MDEGYGKGKSQGTGLLRAIAMAEGPDDRGR